MKTWTNDDDPSYRAAINSVLRCEPQTCGDCGCTTIKCDSCGKDLPIRDAPRQFHFSACPDCRCYVEADCPGRFNEAFIDAQLADETLTYPDWIKRREG